MKTESEELDQIHQTLDDWGLRDVASNIIEQQAKAKAKERAEALTTALELMRAVVTVMKKRAECHAYIPKSATMLVGRSDAITEKLIQVCGVMGFKYSIAHQRVWVEEEE